MPERLTSFNRDTRSFATYNKPQNFSFLSNDIRVKVQKVRLSSFHHFQEAPSSKAQIAFDPLLSYFPTAGATSQQGVISALTFFNLGYTLDKLEIFNFSLIALIASKRLIQDCQLKYRLITYGELSRRHWYSGSLVGDSLLPFKPSNPLPIQLVRGCSIYKVIRSYVLAEEEMCNQRNLSLQVLTCVFAYFG